MDVNSRVSTALILTSVGHLVLEFSNNFLPVLYPLLMPTMGLNFAQIGFITLVASTVLSLSQPFFGYASDRWSSLPLVAISLVWTSIAMGLVGFSRSYSMLLILVAAGSLGSAAFHPPATVTAAENSGKNRGTGLSVFSVGGNIGTALSPLWMVLALGLMGFSGTITVPLFAIPSAVIFYVMMRRYGSTRHVQKEASSTPAAKRFLVGMLLIVAAMMFRSWYQVALMTYLPAWIQSGGGTLAAGSRMLALFLFSISAGSAIGGVSGDRYGHLKVLIVSLILLPVFHWGFMNTIDWQQQVMIFLCGVAVGSSFPTSIVLVLEAWPHQAGVASGLLMGLGWWPGGLGASLTGILADRHSLTYSLTSLTLIPLLGVACLVVYLFASRARERSPARSEH